MKEITGAGEPSSRSSNYRYFFFAVFFLAFFFFAIVISLRVVDWLHVQTAFVSALPMHRFTLQHVIPVLFPKQDYDAWCANSMPRSKKNATLL